MRVFKQVFFVIFFLISFFTAIAQQTLWKINTINFSGNKITRDRIIRRELMFKEGDTLQTDELSGALSKTHDNLINTALFNFVTIDTVSHPGTPRLVDVNFRFVERWYTWPFPVIMISDRNFNTWWENRDFSKLTYGFLIQQNNFRGRKEQLLFTFLNGYNQTLGLNYDIPYVNKSQTLGLTTNITFIRNHSLNYATINNKQLSIRFKDDYVLKQFMAFVRLTYRHNINYYHYLTLYYNRFDFSDTVINLNPEFTRDHLIHPDFFSFSYRFKADFRDYQAYPLKGSFVDIELSKNGFSIPGPGFPDLWKLRGSLRTYHQISKDFYAAAGISGKTTFQNNEAYFLQRGLGYDNDYVRGYEYYVIDAQEYMVFKSNLKWNILPTRISKLPYIPTEKFNLIHYTMYFNVFLDMGYAWDKSLYNQNQLANRWLMGLGTGIDFITYYDRVLRMEIARNLKGETGFYIQFVAPI